MPTTELFVSLKVPDNVAITAFHALERMGFDKLKNLERQDYYKLDFDGNVKSFQDKIGQVDILVNANKHKFNFDLENSRLNQKYPKINVLVQDLDDDNGLLSTLKERLGFTNIKNVEKGVLWSLSIDADEHEAKNIAVEITKNLLMNQNYQKYKILD
jgi:phosphoribosylformylglycinamidine (FGAM) synthase PurS component